MKTEEPWTKKTKTEISNYTINLIDEYKVIYIELNVMLLILLFKIQLFYKEQKQKQFF